MVNISAEGEGKYMRQLPMWIVILIIGLILSLSMPLGTAGYTTPIVWSNKKEYDPSETARLYGYGFKVLSQINITILRPDLVKDTVQTLTDEFGYFACQYLLDGIHGTFTVTATDGANVATTTFDNALYLSAWWSDGDSTYIYAEAGGLSTSKQYYIKYFDPAGVERRKSPTYTGVSYFTDNLTIIPTFPNILGYWTVKLYENNNVKRTKTLNINKIVWTTDSTYTNFVTSFAQGETVYFKTIGLQTNMYYRFKLQMPNGTRFFVGSWTTGVTSMTGSYILPSNAPIGSWKLHVRQATDSSGSCETHYVDCRFQVTTAPPPQQYYLTVRTDPTGIGTILGEGWYNAYTSVNLTAPDIFAGPTGTRYMFNYWDVDGASQGTGVRLISIYMDANHTATAHYVTQYFLNLTTNPPGVTIPAGVGWYNAGTNVPIFAPEFISIEPEASRYRFNGWTTGDMSEIANASATSTTVFLDKPKTVTANYLTQYHLTVTSPYGTPTGEGWYNNGDTAYAKLDTGLVNHGNGTRRVFTSWGGDASGTNYAQSNPIIMNAAKTAIANWKTQYAVNFTQTGSPIAPTVTYTADIDPTETVPFTIWVKAGTEITYTYQDIVTGATGVRYILTSVTPSSPQTVTGPLTISGTYQTQYYLTVNTNPTEVLTLNPAAVSGQGWYNSGSTATVDAVQNVDKIAGASRYDFRSWTGATPTGTGNQATVLMDNPKTATANYQLQYYFTVTSPYDSPTPTSGWFDSGTSITASVTSPANGPSGTRYVCTGWTGTGSVPPSGSGTSVSFFIQEPSSITWNWKTQYLLTVQTNPPDLIPQPTRNPTGEAGPTNGWWYDASTSVTLTAQSITGYTFNNWDVDGNTQGNGVNPITVSMNAPHTATANYAPIISYTLTITTTSGGTTDPAPGSYSYASGSSVPVTALPTANYVLDHWELDSVNVGSANPYTVTMNSDHTLKAVFKLIQYQVTFSQTGVSSDFTGTVVIVDGTNYKVSELPHTFTWDAGSSHSFAFQSPLVVTPNGKQYVWTSTTGLSTLQTGSITVSSSGSVTGNYKTQYYLSVSSPSGYGSPTPTSGWFDASSSITASVTSPWAGTTGTRYICTGWTGTGSVPPSGTGSSVTFTIIQASSITWNWVTQYYLTVRTNPSGIATIPGEGWYNASKSVSLTAPSVSGYTFLNWDVDGTNQGSGVSSITVTMNAPHTATAHYSPVSPPGPVGGYSISLVKQTPVSAITMYAMLIALFGIVLTFTKRKRK